jgi:LL-H family phage holin
MDQFYSDLVNAIIVALVPVAIGALGWLANSVIGYLKARMAAEHYAMLEKIAASTVAAVNQTLNSKAGEEKKQAAIALVRAECAKRGIKLDEEAIGNAVEAAVYRSKLGA